jgi:hypothetical protein
MNTNEILVAIDAEISRLQQAKALLNGTNMKIKRKPGRPAGGNTSLNISPATGSKSTRTLSPEARARISVAQKIHANNPGDALRPLAQRAMRDSVGIPLHDVTEECRRSIDLIAHVANQDGWRHVTEIRMSHEFIDRM